MPGPGKAISPSVLGLTSGATASAGLPQTGAIPGELDLESILAALTGGGEVGGEQLLALLALLSGVGGGSAAIPGGPGLDALAGPVAGAVGAPGGGGPLDAAFGGGLLPPGDLPL